MLSSVSILTALARKWMIWQGSGGCGIHENCWFMAVHTILTREGM